MILVNLWPYALWAANCSQNHLPIKDLEQSPLEKFSGVQVRPSIKTHHVFGCPVYSLDCKLQSGTGMLPKWNPRAQIVIKLGPSPRHARNISLVLSPTTGLVSPWFNVHYDDVFEMVRGEDQKSRVLPRWQDLSCLGRKKRRVPREPSSCSAHAPPSEGDTILLQRMHQIAIMSPDLPVFDNDDQDEAPEAPTSDFVPLNNDSPPTDLEGDSAPVDDDPTPVPLCCSTRQKKMSRRAMESLETINVAFTV
eukprot:12806522-Ditylum_brightwellii.AAC.1